MTRFDLLQPAAETFASRMRPRRKRVVLWIVCSLVLGGCGESDPAKLLESARDNLANEEVAAAIIDSRNALNKQPESAAVRVMLAQALLADGDLAQAATELERATRFGASESDTAPVEAALMVSVGAHKAVVDRYTDKQLPDATSNADLQLQVALAERARGNLVLAEAAARRALASMPRHGKAAALLAALAMDRGDLMAARALVDNALKATPGSSDALIVKGDLLAKNGADVPEALQIYREVLKTRPRSLDAHGRALSLLLRESDLAGAKEQLGQMVKALPGRPFTLFYQASVASMEGDWKRVRNLTQVLLKGPLQVPQVYFIAGVAEMRLGSLAQAETLLSKAARGLPGAADPAVQLAGLQLQLGKPDDALESLRQVLAAQPPVADAFRLAGQAMAQKGNFKAADAAFSQAAAIKPGDQRLRVASAFSRLRRGDTAAGIAELQAAAADDREGIATDMVLLQVHLRNNDAPSALKVVQGIEAKLPGQALPGVLQARIIRQQGDRAGARAAYEKVLVAHPDDPTATADLITLDLAERKTADVRKRLEALLKRDPRSLMAFMALADLERREGSMPPKSFEWLDKAVKLNPTDPAAWKSALAFHREAGDRPALLARARDAMAAVPADVELLLAVADSQLAANDAQQGVSTLNRVVELAPDNVTAHMRLAQLHLVAKRSTAAQNHVTKLLSLQPDSLPTLRLAVRLADARGDAKQKATLIAETQRRWPDSPAGWQLEAEAALADKNWPIAIAAYKKGLSKQETYALAAQLYLAYGAAGRHAEAEAFATAWLARRVADFDFTNFLGEQAARRLDWKTAELRFRQASKLQPEVAAVLNNLAYSLVQLKNPEALEIAIRAVQLSPWSSTFLDTLAAAYSASDQTSRAVKVQLKAVALSPQVGAYRLQLARYQIAAGAKQEARQMLETLAGRGADAGVDAALLDDLLRQSRQ